MHHRFAPKAHRFAYRIFMFALDLDELDGLHRSLRLFSSERRNVYSFRQRDFLPADEAVHNASPRPPSAVPAAGGGATPAAAPASTLKQRVLAHLAARGIDLDGGRVVLLTLPRVFGYLFNPVSFYFCFDRAGEPVAALAEVTNTFREMKPFVLGPDCRAPAAAGAGFTMRTPKHFYVSPFTDMDVAFDFTLRVPADRLAIQIDDYTAGARTLTSALTGTRRPLTDRALAWFTLKYPLITLRVIALIHWHALRLYLKRVPWFRKAARPAEQRDLYRPHTSIAHPSES
jgi:DUF1365 family protein